MINRGFLLLCIAVLWPVFVSAQQPERKDALVVYYSRDGHTKLVAERLAEKFDADIERLIDTKKRTGPIGISSAGKDAIAGNLTALKPLQHDPRAYHLILIGTPSWFGNVTPAVRTFIMKNDLTGKRIVLFGTTHFTGIENALKQAADLIAQDNPEAIPMLALRHRDLQESSLAEKIDSLHSKVMAASVSSF